MKPLNFTPGVPALMSIKDTIATLGMSYRTFYRKIEEGKLQIEFRVVGGTRKVTTRSVEKALGL